MPLALVANRSPITRGGRTRESSFSADRAGRGGLVLAPAPTASLDGAPTVQAPVEPMSVHWERRAASRAQGDL